ncbi:hypothetical protein cypCar_00010690, partial [Cyprinus carpio]
EYHLLHFCVPNLLACLVRTLPHSFSGIVAEDPVIPVDKTLIPSPKHTNPVFDNEEKTKDVAVQQEVSHRVSILEEKCFSIFLGAGDILHASDDLSRVINSYKRIVGGQTIMIDLPGSTASECMYCIMYQNCYTP